ncbi:MAG: hypothetical protein BGO68_02475 [Candidatus Amoebophilus sp. 36-38]|nr:MAG: hypothetical protein BGO68_02475 [Candidatus Amoebophilus sp. 36-38]
MIATPITSLLIFLASILTTNHAQPENEIIPNNKATLNFHIHTLHFIKNNEYFTPIVEGHTLGGYHLHPFLAYQTSENVTTKLGFFIRRYWAEKKLFSTIIPTLTLRYQKQAARFLIGNLKGGSAHQLIRPLYDRERILQVIPETGLQMRYINKHTFLDIWLDWLTLLDKPNNVPEELIAGLSFEQLLAQISSIKITIPVQILLYHLGGQGISIKDFSLWIGTLGGRITFPVSDQGFLKNICLDNYYVANHYVKKIARPFKTGHAFLGQLTFHTSWFRLQGSYWNSYGFSSENLGHPLYQSISISNKQVSCQEKHRHLLLLHIDYQYFLTTQLKLVLQIDPYYDINHDLVEHEAGFYVSYRPSFSLPPYR